MDNTIKNDLQREVKIAFVLTVAEKVFSRISKYDERYREARNALDKCWLWVESHAVSAEELYELIDNREFTGISEFAEDEEDLHVARLWVLLVDAVAFTSWYAFKHENVKYLPQSLEGISDDSIIEYLSSVVENGFISEEEKKSMESAIKRKRR